MCLKAKLTWITTDVGFYAGRDSSGISDNTMMSIKVNNVITDQMPELTIGGEMPRK